ncbi:MAG TPA: transglutaminase family protein, partial [Bryobacteraceae bacterium]|nr:transglutaminase family protein [Bryobacteraceae bacterium]
MPLQVALTHRTHYKYDQPVALGPQVVRLRPAAHSRTPVRSYALKIAPAKHVIHWQQDPHGNQLARVLIPDNTTEFGIEVDFIAELSTLNPFDFFLEPGTEEYPFEYPPELAKDLEPYRSIDASSPLLRAFMSEISGAKRGTVGFLVDLNSRVKSAVNYLTRLEHGVQSCEDTLRIGTGSCRDSAWLLVQVFRQLGFAARFVSGYLIQVAPDDDSHEASAKQDSADLHAWAEVFLPGAGWIGLDPTSGLFTGEGHIPLACTPDPPNAAPITGTVGAAKVDFTFSLSVRRLDQSTRPSRPFTEEAWDAVQQVAQKVDQDLQAMDVRLTMGGEPTFVGMDEPDSPQWNGDAMGPLKRNRAVTLIGRLRDQIAPGGLLHFGQGKWYPGEPLPRWALGCYWRSDGIAVWDNPALIAEEDRSYGFTTADALQFVNAVTRRLGVSSANVLPAFEDTFYYLWRERRLPVNVDT